MKLPTFPKRRPSRPPARARPGAHNDARARSDTVRRIAPNAARDVPPLDHPEPSRSSDRVAGFPARPPPVPNPRDRTSRQTARRMAPAHLALSLSSSSSAFVRAPVAPSRATPSSSSSRRAATVVPRAALPGSRGHFRAPKFTRDLGEWSTGKDVQTAEGPRHVPPGRHLRPGDRRRRQALAARQRRRGHRLLRSHLPRQVVPDQRRRSTRVERNRIRRRRRATRRRPDRHRQALHFQLDRSRHPRRFRPRRVPQGAG